MCQAAAPITCADCERCDAVRGCAPAPAPACRTAPRSLLVLRDRSGTGPDRLVWRWHGGAAPAAEFGDPLTSDGYTACLFGLSSTDPVRLLSARIAPGGTCPSGSTRPCWRAVGEGTRFTYRDKPGASGSLQTLALRAGAAGAGAILARGRGAGLAQTAPPVPPPLLFQLQADNGFCWEALYGPAAVLDNRSGLVKARTAE